ncbi:MAG: hypothetical protein WDO15_20370 [Bacteroidota bacterium]
MEEILQAFERQEYEKVVGLVSANPLSQVIDPDQPIIPYAVAALSHFETGHYSSAIMYSTKLAMHMTEYEDTTEGKQLFEDMINIAVNSYYKLNKRYEGLGFVVRLQSNPEGQSPFVTSLQERILNDATKLLHDRLNYTILAVTLLSFFSKTVGITGLANTILSFTIVFICFFSVFARKAIFSWLKKIVLGFARRSLKRD